MTTERCLITITRSEIISDGTFRVRFELQSLFLILQSPLIEFNLLSTAKASDTNLCKLLLWNIHIIYFNEPSRSSRANRWVEGGSVWWANNTFVVQFITGEMESFSFLTELDEVCERLKPHRGLISSALLIKNNACDEGENPLSWAV